MTTNPEIKDCNCGCSFCGCPHVRAYRIAGALLRYACDECFVTRCMGCGALCVDDRGKLQPGVKFGLHHALYCERCFSAPAAEILPDQSPAIC